MHRNNSVCEIEKDPCPPLAKSFRNYKQTYVGSQMTIFLPPVLHAEDANYISAVRNIHGKKLLKADYGMVILDERYPCRSMPIIQDENALG